MTQTQLAVLTSSVISFPDRGPYGQNSYRGNTSGYPIVAFLQMFHPNRQELFVDPTEGSGTSRDVARALGITYEGFDLRNGFDITMQDLLTALGNRRPASMFFHLPYWKQIIYSDSPRDLSNAPTLEAFLELAQLAVLNGYDALKPGGHYAFLMGNYRKNGIYYPLASVCELIMPGKLKEEIIKLQHNTWSGRQSYNGAGTNFVPIAHEKMLIYEKTEMKFALDFTIENSLLLMAFKDATWKNIIRRAFMRHGNGATPMPLEQIYKMVEASDKARSNPHWQAKVRQIVREHPDVFRLVERGVYALAD